MYIKINIVQQYRIILAITALGKFNFTMIYMAQKIPCTQFNNHLSMDKLSRLTTPGIFRGAEHEFLLFSLILDASQDFVGLQSV